MLTLRQATFKEAGESKEVDVRLMYLGVETNVLLAAKSFHQHDCAGWNLEL